MTTDGTAEELLVAPTEREWELARGAGTMGRVFATELAHVLARYRVELEAQRAADAHGEPEMLGGAR